MLYSIVISTGHEFWDLFRFNIAKGYYWEFKDSNGETVKKVSY